MPIAALMQRHPQLPADHIDDVILGCANQAGEDNRNVARMAVLLAGLPTTVPGVTLNRLCGSGMDAVAAAARSIGTGEADIVIAGGVESMSRAPFVIPKAEGAYSRNGEIFDTTLGWRFINPVLERSYGAESMGETAENVAREFAVSRVDQDAFALRSQRRAAAARASGFYAAELIPVPAPRSRGERALVTADEHPRETSLVQLAQLPTPFRNNGTVTAGNAAGLNDGACALLLASRDAAREHSLTPLAKVMTTAVAGVEPRIMGIGPVSASRKALQRAGLGLHQIDTIEINEAFAAQAIAVLRELGVSEDAAHVNPNGGAIALGHPLGMSGARLIATACHQLKATQGRYALCTMCIGVGQGIAMLLERPAQAL
jgi:3-oxoadipyl-CoA thiolase